VKFNFRKFDFLESAEANSTIDVVGVVKRVGDMAELVSKKTGGALFKRDLTLIDESGIEVCVWVGVESYAFLLLVFVESYSKRQAV
jgi:replication factor A1